MAAVPSVVPGVQLIVVQLTKGNYHKGRCRDRLHCSLNRCNLAEECLANGKRVSLEEARGYFALTYCGSCFLNEDRERLQLPERSKNGMLLNGDPDVVCRAQQTEQGPRVQEKAAPASQEPPAQPAAGGNAESGRRGRAPA